MRQRLDLDTLLRKYETTNILPTQQRESTYYSPRVTYTKEKTKRLKTQTNNFIENDHHYFNLVANRAAPSITLDNAGRSKVNSASFQMSKGECEDLLFNLRQQLVVQQQRMNSHIEQCINELVNRFERQHQEMRRQLLGLIQHSLEMNKRTAFQLIEGYRKQFPKEYNSAKKIIVNIQEDINRLLTALNGNEFKKTIAQIVTKDFVLMLKGVREEVATANTSYRQGLNFIQLDRSKLVKIQQSLHKLYSWNSSARMGNNQKVQNYERENRLKISDDREDPMRDTRRSSKRKIFEQRGNNIKSAVSDRQFERSDRSGPKQMRRTFFNFDNNY